MRLAPSLLLVSLAILPLGCTREVTATKEDIASSIAKADGEQQRLAADIRRYAIENGLLVYNLKADANDFMAQRREQWWNLQEEAAYQIRYEWDQVERLSTDAARAYGYEVRNFPRAEKEIMVFMRRADEEWRRLVQDAGTFIEWRNREATPLRKQIREFYRQAQWEAANGIIDVREFLAWRHVEYRRLSANVRRSLADSAVEWDRLHRDLVAFRTRANQEQQYLVADFQHFARDEADRVPRLMDDLAAFAKLGDPRPLGREILVASRSALTDLDRLRQDAERQYRQDRLTRARLASEVDDFFAVYEREVRPLSTEIKRFWREEISRGNLAMRDLKRFLTHTADEMHGLEQDLKEFISYGSVEWQRLRWRIKEFIVFDQAAFGGGTRSTNNHIEGPVFGDYPVPPGFDP